MNNSLPILYSFRRCPYAIRARLAIAYAGIAVEIREIDLKHKPEHLLAISPKATVPVLLLPEGNVLEESLDIISWALAQHDPDNWLYVDAQPDMLLHWNDGEFKHYLDRYKYADRYPEFSAEYYRQQAEVFLAELEARLSKTRYLAAQHFSLLDAAIFPFIRQFAAVDNTWFAATHYHQLKRWLQEISLSALFVSVMGKHAVWHPGG
jgi:glutathione S-transferase